MHRANIEWKMHFASHTTRCTCTLSTKISPAKRAGIQLIQNKTYRLRATSTLKLILNRSSRNIYIGTWRYGKNS